MVLIEVNIGKCIEDLKRRGRLRKRV